MKLPTPDSAALQHSLKVTQYIADKIQFSGGAIPFSEYMEHVLYAPGLGYYSAGCLKFGEQGDFVTAPEISSLFSRCVTRAITPVFKAINSAQILEVGAGSGRMAADILNELNATETALDKYFILERSAELRERQQITIQKIAPQYCDKVEWLESLPKSFSGVIVANELLDAMPVHRFQKINQANSELYVAYQNQQFIWQQVTNSNSRLDARIAAIEKNCGVELTENYQSEINFAAEDWLSSINDILVQGYILLLDYGYPEKEYYHEQRSSGTLNCYYRHARHDNPFLYPGLQDITAHIDFSNLTASALNSSINSNINSGINFSSAGVSSTASLQLNGYSTQSHFLMASGLMDIAESSKTDDIKTQLVMNQEIKKLTMPYEMGENIKVIGFEKALTDNGTSNFNLPCFSLRDLRYQL